MNIVSFYFPPCLLPLAVVVVVVVEFAAAQVAGQVAVYYDE